MAQVKIYGADWCGDTRRSLRLLDRLQVPYDYINVDNDPEASAWVKAQNGGKERKPTIQIDGQVLAEPDDDELEAALRDGGVLA